MPKSKKSKSQTAESLESGPPPPNPNYKFQFGELALPNGDIYRGDFCIHVSGLIWREGTGKYISHDRHCYLGQWKDDKLHDQVPLKISYPNEDEYRGLIIKGKYNGPGAYTIDKTMDIICEFADNKPKGSIILVDVNGVVWAGSAEKEKAILLPENLFYARIREDFGIGKSIHKQSSFNEKEQEKDDEIIKELTDSERERIIFAKSTKTQLNLQLEDSIWYQKYQKFLNTRKQISKKIRDDGSISLSNQEFKWYKKYKEFKNTKEERLNKMGTKIVDDSEAFGLYEKFKKEDSEGPLRVFYPRGDDKNSSSSTEDKPNE